MKNLIIITKLFRFHDYYFDSFKDLKSKWINVYIFDNVEEKVDKNRVKKDYFSNKNDLISKIKKLDLKDFFIHTFDEHSIILVNELKKYFNQPYTTSYQAFTNKDLQREKFLNLDKNITVNYKIIDDSTNIDHIDLDFPIVVKPVSWAQSYGVKIIETKKELKDYLKNYSSILERISGRGYKNEKFLLEEFIDGTAWSIDYFVDENQNIYLAKPVFLEFWIDIWLDDFCNISRVISEEKENELDLKKLKEFVEKNVKALDIKNTFVHHEFKFTSKWKFKTIELNGRIWGFRLQMYNTCYNLNLLSIPFDKNLENWYLKNKILTNYSIWAIHAPKEWKLLGLNKELENQIKKIKSLDNFRFLEKYIWTITWPTKKWYIRVWYLRLKNKNLKEFKNDYKFVRKNYKNLLIIE